MNDEQLVRGNQISEKISSLKSKLKALKAAEEKMSEKAISPGGSNQLLRISIDAGYKNRQFDSIEISHDDLCESVGGDIFREIALCTLKVLIRVVEQKISDLQTQFDAL